MSAARAAASAPTSACGAVSSVDHEVAVAEGGEGPGDAVRLADLDFGAAIGAQVRPRGGGCLLVQVEDGAFLARPLGGRGEVDGKGGLSGAALAGQDGYLVHGMAPGCWAGEAGEAEIGRGFTLPSPAAASQGGPYAAFCPASRRWWR